MKWNDAWLSNKDCDGDGKLDRPANYIGSGAWETNHQSGVYTDTNTGNECKWNYFVKIIAVPADAEKTDGIWYTSGGVEIGPVLWGGILQLQKRFLMILVWVIMVFYIKALPDQVWEYISHNFNAKIVKKPLHIPGWFFCAKNPTGFQNLSGLDSVGFGIVDQWLNVV